MVLTFSRALCAAVIIGAYAIPAVAQQTPASAPRAGDVRPLLYGFALECIDCAPGEHGRGRGNGGNAGQVPVVSYRTFPRVIAVAPGSTAEQAGIRAGDILRSIDGVSVITDAGAERLSHAAAGQQVRLAFDRGAKPVVVSLTLGATPGARSGSGADRIYGGYVALQGSVRGNVKVEVWSDDPITPADAFPQITSSPRDSTGTIILRIGTNTLIKVQLTKAVADSAKRPGEDETSNQSNDPPLVLRLRKER